MSYEETVMDGKQMATRRDVLQGAVGVVAGGALAFTFGAGREAALAQEASPAAGGSLLAGLGLPELHIRITEDGFDVTPSSIPAGRVLLVVENAASDEASADLIGPPEGMGMDAFMAETQASPVAGSAVGTPGVESGDEGFPSWLYEARLTGGPVVQAGQTGYAVVELAAGDWAVAGEGNQAPAMVTATGEAGATPAAGTEPPADLAVTMQDYAFVGLPETVPPGRQIWKVTNQGPEIHMMIVSSAPAGVTLQEILDTFQALGPNGTPAPGAPIQESDFGPAMGQEISSVGQTTWVELDLAPGSYLVACYVPDEETGMPHAFMGMAALVTAGGSVEATPTG